MACISVWMILTFPWSQKDSVVCFCFCFLKKFFIFGCKACEILVPWPGIEPSPPAVAGQSLNHWITREAPRTLVFYLVFPESCLDKPGRFVEFSLFVIRQGQLCKFILHLLTGGRTQELRPVCCRGKAGLLKSYFTDWWAYRAQAGIRRRGERLIICTSETKEDMRQRGWWLVCRIHHTSVKETRWYPLWTMKDTPLLSPERC